MSLATTHCRAAAGIDAPPVSVEVHLANGLPAFHIVGLPEKAVQESRDRVRGALLNAGFEFPARRITVNLAPADLPKQGSRFDLAIAVGQSVVGKQPPVKPELARNAWTVIAHSQFDLENYVAAENAYYSLRGFTPADDIAANQDIQDRTSYAGLIADGAHVHPAALAVAAAAKTPDRIVLVTDAMATVGAPGARFDWDGRTVTARDGCCRLPDGALAGSDLDMIRAVRNIMRFAALDRDEAGRTVCVSLSPPGAWISPPASSRPIPRLVVSGDDPSKSTASP